MPDPCLLLCASPPGPGILPNTYLVTGCGGLTLANSQTTLLTPLCRGSGRKQEIKAELCMKIMSQIEKANSVCAGKAKKEINSVLAISRQMESKASWKERLHHV